jgi:hypothetical protein
MKEEKMDALNGPGKFSLSRREFLTNRLFHECAAPRVGMFGQGKGPPGPLPS